jgi:hypothetical protein
MSQGTQDMARALNDGIRDALAVLRESAQAGSHAQHRGGAK